MYCETGGSSGVNVTHMITHVAIKYLGQVWSLPEPNRHADVIRLIREQTHVLYVDVADADDEGFLDDQGKYYNRKQAVVHAIVNDQVDASKVKLGMLFSDDVW